MIQFVAWIVIFASAALGFRLGDLGSDRVVRKLDESFLVNPRYHQQQQLEELFDHLQGTYPTLAKKFSIGESTERRSLVGIQISENVGAKRELLRPMVKFSANIHGDESVGRQMLVYLAEFLLLNYEKDDELAKLVNETDIHLLPSINPDGFSRSKLKPKRE